mgnify:CR=1 FL=1
MIFFRQNLQEVITLPEPPVEDLTEAYEVEEIIRRRTEKDVQSIQDHDQEPYYAIRKVCGLPIAGSLAVELPFAFEKNRIYNCVENPILPDGSGGCYLFSFGNTTVSNKLQGCSIAPADNVTSQNCNNQQVFEGGFITDASFFLQYDEFTDSSDGSCTTVDTESRYIIGGTTADNLLGSNVITSDNGAIVTSEQLSWTQDQHTYYPGEYEAARKLYLNEQKFLHSRVSDPYVMSISVLLFTSAGEPYTGSFIVVSIYGSPQRNYYAYDPSTGVQLYELFYTRNSLLGSVPDTDQEVRAKKMNKVIKILYY